MHEFDTYISGVKLAKRAADDKSGNAVYDNGPITFMWLSQSVSISFIFLWIFFLSYLHKLVVYIIKNANDRKQAHF